jgi:hypothetical protein
MVRRSRNLAAQDAARRSSDYEAQSMTLVMQSSPAMQHSWDARAAFPQPKQLSSRKNMDLL